MAEQKVMERDPVCGMRVDPASARAKVEHGGKTYFFCCTGCAKKFEAAPEQYLKPRAAPSGASVPTLAGVSPAAAPIEKPIQKAVPLHPSAVASLTLKADAADYICPMDPEVHQTKPGACPKCGMALEASVPFAPAVKTEYVCPMHPQIVRFEPGSCPICGMALEPRVVSAEGEKNAELTSMTRRFWVGVALTI